VEPEQHISETPDRRSSAWDIQNAPKNYLSLILAQGGGAFFAFASVWLLTRTLGSTGYGGVVAIIAASQVAQMLSNWTIVAVVRFGVEEFIETGKIARIFWVRFLLLIPQIALVLAFSFLWYPPLAGWLKLSPGIFWFVIWHFASACIWLHIQYSLQGVKLQRLQGILLMAERMLVFTGIIILMSSGQITEISAIVIYSAVPLITAAIGVWFLRRFIFSGFKLERRVLNQIFIYSLPLLPFTLLGYFSTGYVDAVFVTKFLSTAQLGIYAVAGQINGIALQAPTLANSLLIPLFVTLEKEANSKKTETYFKDILPGLTLFWGFSCACLSFLAYFAVPLIFGSEFSGAGKALWILFAGSTASFPVLVGYAALVHSTSNTTIALAVSLVIAVINIGFNFMLIPVFGIEGCAWATALAYLAGSVGYAALLKRRVKMNISWTFFAIAPVFCGALALTLTGNPYWSILSCFAASFIIVYLQKNSLFRTINFLKNFARR
jgi:O-antigen/teichoic acid export membrane protein